MKIRKSAEKDFNGIINIVKILHPKWFDKDAINRVIPLDLKIQKAFVAEEKGKILGFITYFSNEAEVKIGWMGVNPEFQREGIGTKLIKRLEKELEKIGVKELRVDTLASSIKYGPYEITRAFYRKMGFKVEKVTKRKSKDTGEEFDLATLVKTL